MAHFLGPDIKSVGKGHDRTCECLLDYARPNLNQGDSLGASWPSSCPINTLVVWAHVDHERQGEAGGGYNDIALFHRDDQHICESDVWDAFGILVWACKSLCDMRLRRDLGGGSRGERNALQQRGDSAYWYIRPMSLNVMCTGLEVYLQATSGFFLRSL